MGAAVSTGVTGNPLFLLPSAVGEAARHGGEALVRSKTNKLGEMLRNGGPLKRPEISDERKRIIMALLATQLANAAEQKKNQK